MYEGCPESSRPNKKSKERFAASDEERKELLTSPYSAQRRKLSSMKIVIGFGVLCALAFSVAALGRRAKGSHAAFANPSTFQGSSVNRFKDSTANNGNGGGGGGGKTTPYNPNTARVTGDSKTRLHDIDCSSVLSCNTQNMIDAYHVVVERIIEHVTVTQKGQTWQQLADFVDTFGPRFTGTDALENAIDDRVAFLANVTGPENVHVESVLVPVWIRGETEVTLLNAWFGGRNKSIAALTLGSSTGTVPEGVTAEAVVVKSFDELDQRTDVAGKIVVFNQEFVNYRDTVLYRTTGAAKAAAKGAVAVLVRSITDYSLYTPHTGYMTFPDNVTPIPALSITVEDAELMWRKQQRGEKLVLYVRSTARKNGLSVSRNVVAEIPGSGMPDETVIIGGHIDSWDVGQGAMDDGGGISISWRAIEVLRNLNLQPHRTIRAVLFTAEEVGIIGGNAYFDAHKQNASNVQFIMESDIGVFTPLGLSSGIKNEEAFCIIERTLRLFEAINATQLDPKSEGPDIESWFGLGVPGASLYNANKDYFKYHHTDADTMYMMMPDAMDAATALWASVAYIFADLAVRIPHDPPASTPEPQLERQLPHSASLSATQVK